MKNLLLLTAGIALSASVSAQNLVDPSTAIRTVAPVQKADIEVVKSLKNDMVLEMRNAGGRAVKKLIAPKASKRINPVKKQAAPAKEAAADEILFESFEDWDGETLAWVPDGWTIESNGDETELSEKWTPTAASSFLPPPTDGDYYFGINFSSKYLNEWLISPVVEVPEGQSLTYDIYLDPFWFYNLDNVDWETYEFQGPKEIVFDIKVNIREEGGEWATLVDYAEKFKDWSGLELIMYDISSLTSQDISLAAYAGKKIQVAFQYVGTDGQSCFIDNIRIGLPKLEGLTYMMPFNNQYWGFSRDFNSVNFESAFLPAFADNTFMMYDYVPDAEVTWQYNDPTDADNWLTAEGDELTINYGTDYTNDFTTRTNLYYLPTMTVSAPGFTTTSYKNPADYMQIGGKPTFLASSGELVEMGVLPFMFKLSEIGVYTYRMDFGMTATPIYGHNADTDAFWTEYSFHGEGEEGDNVKLTGILNFIYSGPSPMVVSGAHLLARTENIADDVEFTAQIVPINESYEPDFTRPLATATVKAKDFNVLIEGDQEPDYTMISFDFPRPVVLDDSEPAYIIAITGFNNPGVGYFAPYQQIIPEEPALALGWTMKEITYNGSTVESYSNLISPTGEDLYTAFAICLDATLPWLQCEAESVDISANGTTVGLDSYYDAADLQVVAPEWAEVELAGRYADCTMTVKAEYSDTARDGEIVIMAPGVTKVFALHQAAGTGSSSITAIAADNDATIEAVYNLAGVRVNPAALEAGVYLVKYTSGKVAKIAVK
ncbi:MAG: choice-of-anchor J domain-containing protein [Lachnoclostridium sp.]|nr:choice-of-anchor J domain-containing protein [Lachnoclostridium sp.]